MDKNESLVLFGELIRKLRMDQQLTQVDLANKCHFNKNYIGMLERGEINPTYLTLKKLAETLNVSFTIG